MLLYFLKNEFAPTQETFNRLGLSYLNKAEFSKIDGAYPIGSGSILGYSKYQKSGECLIKYKKEEQEWFSLDESKNVYIGLYKDKELDLTTLEKEKHGLVTEPFLFGDGRVYNIPVAMYLPQSFALSKDGKDIFKVEKKYKELADIAQKYTDIYNTEKVSFDPLEGAKDIANIMSHVYKFGLKEMRMAELITTTNVFLFFVTFLQLTTIKEKIAKFDEDNQKKN